MNDLVEMLDDWKAYCSDPNSGFDTADFAHILSEQPDESELRQFFAPFPGNTQQQLLDRTLAYLAGQKMPAPTASDAELIHAAEKHVAELRRQAEMVGSSELVAGFGVDKEYRIVDDDEIDRRRLDTPDRQLMDLVGEEVSAHRPVDRQTLGLFEAFYGAESSFYIQWYLAQPVIDLDLDMSPYYELRVLDGDCLVDVKYVAVARTKRPHQPD